MDYFTRPTPSPWTKQEVMTRLKEAVDTARLLRPAKAPGYFNLWPTIVRQSWEKLSLDDNPHPRVEPPPQAIEQMMEAMRWMQWLDEPERHLLWMHAKELPRAYIAKQGQISRATLWRRWQATLNKLADLLNARQRERA